MKTTQPPRRVKIKLKKGDLVRVMKGKHKGLESPILKIDRCAARVQLEGVSATKHVKPTREENEGGIQTIPFLLPVSNVALIDPKQKKAVTKIGYQITGKTKQRIARKSKAKLS